MSTSGKKHEKKNLSWKCGSGLTVAFLFHRFLPQVSIPGSRILEKLRIREQGKLRLERELGGGFKHFLFYPYLGKWSNLTNSFQRGWNHQLEKVGGLTAQPPVVTCSAEFSLDPMSGQPVMSTGPPPSLQTLWLFEIIDDEWWMMD